jgi:hypothetical protein
MRSFTSFPDSKDYSSIRRRTFDNGVIIKIFSNNEQI